MKSFPAHYHLVEFIYSTLNFNSREQALVTKQENHRFISIESIIDYFTRCKECKFEITERERKKEREKNFGFYQRVSRKTRGWSADSTSTWHVVADQQENSISLTTNNRYCGNRLFEAGARLRVITIPVQRVTLDTELRCRLSSWPHPASFLIPTFIRGWRLHKAILPISLGI